MGRTGRTRPERDGFTSSCAFTARNDSDSDAGRSKANRNAIDRAAVDCLADSNRHCDSTADVVPESDAVFESNANSHVNAATKSVANIDRDDHTNRDCDSASKSDSDADRYGNGDAEPDTNAHSASEPVADGNVYTANCAERDAVAIRQPEFDNCCSARTIATSSIIAAVASAEHQCAARRPWPANRSRSETPDDRRF